MGRTISEAEAATDAASVLAGEAADSLAAFTAGTFDGFGLFSDPSRQRAHLAAAARAVTAALAAMDAVRWPSPADLRALDDPGASPHP